VQIELKMQILSDTVNRVKPSPTIMITDLARKMSLSGQDVISLSAGEPDFDTPQNIKDRAIRAIKDGQTKYTAVDGITELKSAICKKFSHDNNLNYTPDQISVSTGGKQILFNALIASLNTQDEVIIPAPYWVSYPDMVRLAGGTPVIVETSAESGFKLTPSRLMSAITAHTKWLIMNSPANPTGSGYTRSEIKALTEVLLRHPSIWIMSDDIYEKIVFDDFRFCTIAEVEPALHDRTLTCNGLSKAYAMTGWRLGFAGAPKPLIDAMRKIQSQSTSNPCSITQWAAVEALNGPQEFIDTHNKIFKRRRDFVTTTLNSINGLHCRVPEGAFYLYISIAELIGKKTPRGTVIVDDESFSKALLEETAVAVVPGAAFGLSPYIRISYACADIKLSQACERIQDFVHNLC